MTYSLDTAIENLRALLALKGMTKKELSLKIEQGESYIHRYINYGIPKGGLRANVAQKIADALGEDVRFITGERPFRLEKAQHKDTSRPAGNAAADIDFEQRVRDNGIAMFKGLRDLGEHDLPDHLIENFVDWVVKQAHSNERATPESFKDVAYRISRGKGEE